MREKPLQKANRGMNDDKVSPRDTAPSASFKCVRCGACCEWKGYVRLTDDDVDRIAGFLGMDIVEFTDQYTRLTEDRRSLALLEKESGACVFYEPDPPQCVVNEVKPTQCVEFPFGWRNAGWEKVCAGARNGARKIGLTQSDRECF